MDSNSSFLTPEVLEALLRAGPVDNQRKDLEEQMRIAEALRSPPGGSHHTTGLGAALGGAADIIKDYKANQREQSIEQQRQGLYRDQAAATRAALLAYQKAQNPQQPAADPQVAPGRAPLQQKDPDSALWGA